ncbi:nitrate reductase subunit alpha [Halalkaliarchaeum desulfuricum]|uniref:Nitrate reductase subunit alpha n=1 Tax=Halalkaliarchaeum desulfuricum TaxID=2055893 RepID=A0A343TLN8_9EURY|nr:molybdopterin-dependent oxidoreductase [Halalkaliarchaeum desulfuricum]AUX10010.1 nitrate reductase subunit alpha [Halalkaliarchaeum desulfuricum]
MSKTDPHDTTDRTDDANSSGSEGGLDRRRFLQGTGLAALAGASGLGAASELLNFGGLETVDDPIGNYPYREWEDLYREEWDWDSVARSTHGINCTGSCSWNVYVKNGQVWREEQASDYPDINPDLPTNNPRGCQNGACFSDYVNADHRVKYPLRRTGERGEGKWERISWDEALEEIAEHVIEKVQEGEYDGIDSYTPIPAMSPVSFASGTRFVNLLGGVSHSFYDWYCDLPPGQPLTWGHQTDNAESSDWYNADYLIAWGSNINMTRIPDAKYFTESRYGGAKTVGVFSDYSATAIHTDEWLSPDYGTDAALALGMARVIVEEELYDEAHLKEQTDMPILVREDTGKFLRADDVGIDADDPEHAMVMVDADDNLRVAPGSLGTREGKLDFESSIEIDFDPQLDVETTVATADGDVHVRSVWNNLRDRLAEYTPERVHEETGVGRETHQRIAREFADVDRGKIVHGKGVNAWYHNDLGNRALQLLLTLTGNLGENGTGFDHYVGQEKIWLFRGWQNLSFPTGDVRGMPTTLWTYYHADILDVLEDDDQEWVPDEYDTAERIRESIDEGWMPMHPEEREDGTRPDPNTMFIWRANYFGQAKGGRFVEENLWPKLDLVVDINFRMDTTALYSDIVLPAATWYEKYDLNVTDMHTYVHPCTPAIEPMGESKPDWEIFRLLAEKVQEIAQERGIDPIPDRSFDREIDLQSIHDDYVRDWLTGEEGALDDGLAAAEFILENSDETNPDYLDEQITFEDTVEHPQRFLGVDPHWTSSGELDQDNPYVPWQDHIEDKVPWRTYTGRQQYYIDHDWFLDFGEELPTFKEPLETQDTDEYPLEYIQPHNRLGVHSTWRDDPKALRLQRGGPMVWLHPEDAKERGIEDGDTVVMHNELGEIEGTAKYYPSMPRGTTMQYFAWERYQYPNRQNFNTLLPMRMKPTQLIQYPEENGEHLHFFPNFWGPTGVNNDTHVEVRPKGGDSQ